MNYLALPLVRRLTYPDEYPYSRAKIRVGDDWFIIIADTGGPLLRPEVLRPDSPTDPMMAMSYVAYRCLQCGCLFMDYDHVGYIHKCCEIE